MQALLDYCSKWGKVVDSVIMEGRGFGFVTFEDSSVADSFIHHDVPHMIEGRTVEAKRAVPRHMIGPDDRDRMRQRGSQADYPLHGRERDWDEYKPGGPRGHKQEDLMQPCKLFIGGIGDISDEVLRRHFAQFGEVVDCAIVTDGSGKRRGFGFVTYADPWSIERVLSMPHEVGNRFVDVKRAVPRDEMDEIRKGSGYMDMPRLPSHTAVREGDWVCEDCGNHNFSFRIECKRCKKPRLPAHRSWGSTNMGAGFDPYYGVPMAGGYGGLSGFAATGYSAMNGGYGAANGMAYGMRYDSYGAYGNNSSTLGRQAAYSERSSRSSRARDYRPPVDDVGPDRRSSRDRDSRGRSGGGYRPY
eukprot:jgi/Chlat1/3266/Chrsp22S03437